MTEPLKIQEDNVEESPQKFVSAYDLGSTQGTEMSSRKSEESVSTEGSQMSLIEGFQPSPTETSSTESTSTKGSQPSPTETSSTESTSTKGSQPSPTETSSTETSSTEGSQMSLIEGFQPSPTETSSTKSSQPSPTETSSTKSSQPSPTETSSTKSSQPSPTESTSTKSSQPSPTETSSTKSSQPSPTETSSTESSQPSPTETSSTKSSQPSPTETSSTEGSQSSNMKSIVRERSPLIVNLREKSKQVTQKKYNSDINSAKNIHKSFSKKCYTINKWKPSKKQQWRNKLINVMSKIISHSRKKNTYDKHNVQLDNLRNKINADLNKMTTCSKKPKPQKNTRKSNKK
jgi:hypothetical protein